jgi:hypothetical protein
VRSPTKVKEPARSKATWLLPREPATARIDDSRDDGLRPRSLGLTQERRDRDARRGQRLPARQTRMRLHHVGPVPDLERFVGRSEHLVLHGPLAGRPLHGAEALGQRWAGPGVKPQGGADLRFWTRWNRISPWVGSCARARPAAASDQTDRSDRSDWSDHATAGLRGFVCGSAWSIFRLSSFRDFAILRSAAYPTDRVRACGSSKKYRLCR